MLRNALLNPVKDMTTNVHKLMVLSNYINVLCCFGFANILIFIIHYTQKQKKYTATRCGIFSLFLRKTSQPSDTSS